MMAIHIALSVISYYCDIILASGMSSNVGSQTRWDNHLGVFRTSPGDNNPSQSRNAQTAALVHFSKIIGCVNRKYSYGKIWLIDYLLYKSIFQQLSFLDLHIIRIIAEIDVFLEVDQFQI